MSPDWTVAQVRTAIRAKTTRKVFLYVVISKDRMRPTQVSKAAALRLFKIIDSQEEVETASWIDNESHTILAIGGRT